MTIQAGETTQPTAPAATVDAEKLAHSIVNAVAQLNVQTQSQPSRSERVSAFKSKADELLKSEKIDKDVMPVMLELIEAMEKDLTEKQRTEAMAAAAEAQTKAIHSELGRMVERYAKTSGDPGLIRGLKKTIIEEAISAYNSNPKLVHRYQTTGEVDWDEFDKLVVNDVTAYNKRIGGKPEDKPAAGGPAMKNDKPADAGQPSGSINADDLNERQREIYNAQVSFQMKQAGLTREKAQERALLLIQNAENKVKSQKR